MTRRRYVLTIEVVVDFNGTEPAEIRENLLHIPQRAASEGLMTGATEAEVDTWSARIEEFPA